MKYLDKLKDIYNKSFSKLIHKTFLFLTYPARKPLLFLAYLFVFIVIIFAIPMIKGVSFKDALPWYFTSNKAVKTDTLASKIQNHTTFKETPVLEDTKKPAKFKKVIKLQKIDIKEDHPFVPKETVKKESAPDVPETEESQTEPLMEEIKPTPKKYTVWNIPEKDIPQMKTEAELKAEAKTRKQQIVGEKEKIKEPFASQKIAAIEPALPPKTPEKKPQKVQETIVPVIKEPTIESFYRKVDFLDISYLDKPEPIEGSAMVYGANELYVADTYLYLYGIYTDENKVDTLKAAQYLRELIDGKPVKCQIVAYTTDQIATAVCFVDGHSINQNMVDAGMAQNVAL